MSAVTSSIRKVSGNRWLAVALLIGSLSLFILVAADLGGGKLALPPLTARQNSSSNVVPVNKINQLSTNLASIPNLAFADGKHPFFTLHFKQAPPPEVIEPSTPVPPPPPPPEMEKINLVYRGVYQSSEGKPQAFLAVDSKLTVMPTGSIVVGDWAIAEIGRQKLTLTNASAQTTILEFNRAMELEIPAIKP